MKNNSVSAVIGVVLMVVITVAIAATVYVYVSGLFNDTEIIETYVEGNVTSVVEYTIMNNEIVYNVTLNDIDTYLMVFENDPIPSVGMELRFYYTPFYDVDYLSVYRIESL